ncbi:MAG: AAA family ATPase [Candidatus Methanomethylophilaceae archaeon]|nr:AAA family ATPase [Candidatus Methanomethylophilaceae archaeon]
MVGYPVGISSFEKLVDKGYPFVDKSMIIADLIDSGREVTLYTRPRRFGKSLNLSMIECFFDISRRGKKDLFEGLRIERSDRYDLCYKKEQCAHPVIRLSFADIDVSTVESLESSMRNLVSMVAEKVRKQILPLNTDELDLERIERYSRKDIEREEMISSMHELCRILSETFGSRTIVLIDEYDRPFQAGIRMDHSDPRKTLLSSFMTKTLKDNDHLEFGVMTGIIRLSNAGILSGLNNIFVSDIFSHSGQEFFGITEDEAINLLGSDSEKDLETLKEWYDGYRFGDANVFNPWSIMCFLDNGRRPEPYWDADSQNYAFDRQFMSAPGSVTDKISKLFDGKDESVVYAIDRTMDYESGPFAEDRQKIFYTFLAMTGYLKAIPLSMEGGSPLCRLSVPNKEVKFRYSDLIARTRLSHASAFVERVLQRDEAGASVEIEKIFHGLSYDDGLDHDTLKRMLTMHLGSLGYDATDEQRRMFGDIDILLSLRNGMQAVIELKTSKKTSARPDALAIEAVDDVRRKGIARNPYGTAVMTIGLGVCPSGFSAKIERVAARYSHERTYHIQGRHGSRIWPWPSESKWPPTRLTHNDLLQE